MCIGTPRERRCTSTPTPTRGRPSPGRKASSSTRRSCLSDNQRVRTSRHAWWIAGVVAGMAGLATSYFVAMVMTIRESPVVAVAVQYDPQLTDVLPILVGFVTWVVCLSVLTDALRSEERRAARAAAADPGDPGDPVE